MAQGQPQNESGAEDPGSASFMPRSEAADARMAMSSTLTRQTRFDSTRFRLLLADAARLDAPEAIQHALSIRRQPLPGPEGGLELSQLGVGTWQWGNKLLWGYDEADDDRLAGVFDAFADGGATWFDTGDSYGTGELEGQAERLLGRFSRARLQRGGSPVVLATKLAAYPWRLTPESMVEAVRASNARVGRPVDLAQMHWSPRSYGLGFQEDALLEGLCRCYEAGLCRAVGLSNFGPRGLRRAAAALEARGVPLALNQVQFSLLSEERRSGVAEVCRELGVRLVAYSPLCLGLLAGRYGAGADGAPAELPKSPVRALLFSALLADAGLQRLLGLLREIAGARGKTPAQVALNWALEAGGGCAIVGARSAGQAEENLGACGWRLTPGEVQALEQAAEKAPRTQKNPFFSD
ncbi:unnamed protein product [Prorocentrum cordatum]|uniref:NADP-dependent oxidoreductase domain-containing protein n=1 Tax=Prorocentrum cordatum TaxID=2364126 RepID=A0ABN9V3W9_9DINO|nr:unnamed protein product [Polarella glacialis]